MNHTYTLPDLTPVLSVADMRRSDAYTIAHFTDSKTLMYRAGKGIFDSFSWHGRVALVCGSGNNAGDGYVLALLLAESGIACKIFLVGDGFSPDGAYYFEKCKENGILHERFGKTTDFSDFNILVDCIFGTGFHGEVSGEAADAIRKINARAASGAAVVSADINSGLDGDTGEGALCVRSTLTVSIGFYQPGHFCGRAREVIGSLVCRDIGILPLGEILEYR